MHRTLPGLEKSQTWGTQFYVWYGRPGPPVDAITFVRTQNGVSNLWSKPIDGGPAKRLTNFTSLRIWSHAWSRDGKYLVMGRGNYSRDAVMLTDLH